MVYQPAIFYLNGSYWGIQNLREKIDGDYIESNYGISKDDVDLIETAGNAIEGTNEAYFSYLDSLQKIDLSSADAFSFIDRHIDVQEFINYLTAEIYYCNTDWPGNNVKFWRQRSVNGKFRWILWDLDFGFELYPSASWATHPTLYFATEQFNTGWPNPAWSTLHFRLLLQNPVFRSRFIQTFTSSLNTTFNPDRVISMINSFQQRIATEIPYHTARWGMSADYWNNEVQRLRNFAIQRNSFMHEHVKEFFGLYDQVNVSLLPDGHGSISFNGITNTTPATDIRYFRNMPYTAKAVPANGYRFKNWKITKKESTTIPLVVTDSQWKYYDQGNQPSGEWHSQAFDDSSWPQGSGQFGYGEGDEQTTISYGGDESNKYITTYFRNSFEISDTTSLQAIEVSILYDDAVAVYLNGIEVYRDNLPGGSIDYSTLALGAIPTENVFSSFVIPKGIIRPGQNVIAAEVHQNSPQSSDISFHLTMQTSRLGSQIETTSTAIVLSDTAKSDVVLEAFFEPASALEGLVINEVAASASSVTDENNDHEDWIELFNAGNQPIDISGLFLTDDPANKMKHMVATGKNGETTIPPGGYKILWADEDLYQGATHLNFKLSNEGETVGLYQLTGSTLTKLDEVIYPESGDNVSFSRIPNATGPFMFTAALTPLQENTFVTGIEEGEVDEVKLYPNPSANDISIESAYNIRSITVHDSHGSIISHATSDGGSLTLDVRSWAPGLYAIVLQTDQKLIMKRFVKK
jgi:hypothetical protein